MNVLVIVRARASSTRARRVVDPSVFHELDVALVFQFVCLPSSVVARTPPRRRLELGVKLAVERAVLVVHLDVHPTRAFVPVDSSDDVFVFFSRRFVVERAVGIRDVVHGEVGRVRVGGVGGVVTVDGGEERERAGVSVARALETPAEAPPPSTLKPIASRRRLPAPTPTAPFRPLLSSTAPPFHPLRAREDRDGVHSRPPDTLAR